MAAASGSNDDERPRPRLQRRSSLRLPPGLSELRVVLLGNSWSERSSMGNFILAAPVFNVQQESDGSEKVSGKIDKTRICLINTPDLLHQKIPERKLKKQVGLCMRLAAPGPHVFLLVLQAEEFTEEQNMGLCRVLRLFSDRAFDHSLVLISSREQSSGSVPPSLNNFNRMCKYNYRKLQQLSHPELLALIAQIAFRNQGAHVGCEVKEDSAAPDVQTPGQREAKTPSAAASELKIVLLGDSEYEKTKLGNFIIKDQVFTPAHSRCVSACGEWRGKRFTAVKTPDMVSLSKETVRGEVRTLCPAPPAVLLLVVNAGFTEGDRTALMSILPLFGEDPVKCSMVIISQDCTRMTNPLVTLLTACGKRHYCVNEDNRALLMKKVEDIVHKNKESLNVVLCGSRSSSGTSSVAEDFFGLAKVGSKHQLDMRGRQVSLVQLPALYRKHQEAKLNESFRCVSHCDPEGVHAFLLVLPLGPLRDEDEKELHTIQSVFGSGVNDFTLILFVLDSDATDPADVDFQQTEDFQELCQRCGGRYVTVNTQDKQQVTEVLDTVEKMKHNKDKACSYTTETFTKAQIQTIVQLQKLKDRRQNICDEDTERPECLRIVLIGKTGCGKSASGNTILGRQEFKSELNQMSVTQHCQKAQSEVDGRPVVVVDTPGVFDTGLSHEEVYEELVKCVTLLAPGPHVFLLVIKLDKFTKEDKKALKLIKEGFGRRSEKFTIVLLTGGDRLEKENMPIEDFMENKCDVFFKSLISDCGGRYHVLNNLDRNNPTQVRLLIDKICCMVKDNGGSCFTNEMLQQSEAALQRDMERILKDNEDMRRERDEVERKHEEKLQVMKNKLEKQKEEIALERKRRERELREKEANIQQLEDRIKEQENREKERKDWWEKRQHEEKLEKLKEEFKLEKEKYEEKQREDPFRKEQEESERREVEEKYNEQLEELKKKHEEEARRQAEEVNKFKDKYDEELEALTLQHERELKVTEEKHREEMKRKEKEQQHEKEKERKLKKDLEDLRREHEERIKNLKKKHRRNCKIS